jgi:predicted nucleotidyltransferase
VNAQEIAEKGLILRGLVGSTVHGVTVDAHDDRDEMGLTVEPPEYVIGLRQFEQYEYRTQGVGSGRRSGPGDLDYVCYGLRKWVRLAAAGNPSIMLLLFTPELVTVTDAGYALRDRKGMFLSRSAGFRFLGYLESQRQQIAGEKRVHTNRPELITEYGFDTKSAYHMVRMGLQGIELLTTGTIELPIKPMNRAWLTDLRNGLHTKAEALEMAGGLADILRSLADGGADLPEKADMAVINRWLVDVYQSEWDRRGY